MKLLNILFLVTLTGQTVFAEAQTAAKESGLLSPFQTVLTLMALFVITRLFGVKPKKKVQPEKPQKTVDQLVLENVGELQLLDNKTLVGSKLFKTEKDVETLVFVAKVDKRAEVAELKKKNKKTKVQFLTVIFVLLVTLVWTIIN
ncbi:hypothetical protein [Flexithrix dorotheae]|uniref:hypothetical protein n=1 Tax=Flexithrix dorotheae TaxID=70993 RepID=UPI00036D47BD|nr:hypothetical protein [Flexithrix dorotheae]